MDAYCAAVCWHSLPALAELGYRIEGCQARRDRGSFARRSGGELGKQSEDPSFLLIEAAIKERNHGDESVCHLQGRSFQVSLGRESAVPMWVGMGWLETKSVDYLQSKQYTARCPLIRLTRAEFKLQLIPSIARRPLPVPHQHQKKCDRELDGRASHPSSTAFGTAALALLGFFMREWIRSVLPAFDTDLFMTLIYWSTPPFRLQLISFQQAMFGCVWWPTCFK